MKTPSKKKTVKILQNSYDIEFGNTGQFLDIVVLKTQLSSNTYDNISTKTMEGMYGRFVIDMIATFNTLIPSLKKDMKVDSIADLDLLDTKKLLKVYLKEVLPWMNEWYSVLSDSEIETSEEKDEDDKK